MLALLAGAVLLQQPLLAQAPALGRIEGVVIDSVHARPLAGATVLVFRVDPAPTAFTSTVTDGAGRFRIDSLIMGRYAVSFTNPLLDSLDLVIPDREVVLRDGERLDVALALPSPATLRGAACPGLVLGTGLGAVVGTVTEASSARPVPGATVVVEWVEVQFDRATARPVTSSHNGSVPTDSGGRYRLCGVPTDVILHLQVQHGAAASGIVDVMVSDSVGMRRQRLSVGNDLLVDAATDSAFARRATSAAAAAEGDAAVSGVVLGPDDKALRDVELRLSGTHSSVRSDEEGRFTITGLPAGTQMLEARRVGYGMSRVPVELRNGQTVTQSIRLGRVVELDSVHIVAERVNDTRYERTRSSGGYFIDEHEILRRGPVRTLDLIRTMPGFRVQSRGEKDVVVSSRGQVSMILKCPVNIVIDGIQGLDVGQIHPADIEAIEAYPGFATIPPRYMLQSPCGAIIIWTKR